MTFSRAPWRLLVAGLLVVAPSFPLEANRPAARRLVTVSGMVYDSLAGAPLAGADVQLLPATGNPHSRDAVTDTTGRFAFVDVDSGSYLVSAFHPRIDSLGIELPPTLVEVATTQPVDVQLAIPSRRSIVAGFCPDSIRHDATTVLTGSVRDAGTGLPRQAASVIVHWGLLAIDSSGLANVRRGGPVDVRPDGRFVVCNIPLDAPLTARAAAGPDTSGSIDLEFPSTGILARDLFVPARSDKPSDANTPPPVALATLRGRVVSASGGPVADARVALFTHPVEVRTNARGEFVLPNVPGGTTSVAVRAVGYEALRRAIDLRTGTHANTITVTLTRSVTRLATVEVLESADDVLSRVGFEARSRGGFGKFLDADQVEKSRAVTMTALVGRYPGTVIKSSGRGSRLFMINARGQVCAPTVWVDGQRLEPTAESDMDPVIDLDFWADQSRLAGIEIYTRPSLAPLQFAGTTRQGCGLVVIWHRTRPAKNPQ